MRRPGAVRAGSSAGIRRGQAGHSLVREHENARLFDYEQGVKRAFDNIVPTLKQISALQHEVEFEREAQRIAREQLGFELPETVLADAWVDQLDMRRLYAWCTFSTYRRFSDEFFRDDPLAMGDPQEFQSFLEECGFHTLDISPCADGRLAHLVGYVLRLPHRGPRRKSYAGAMFDVEESIHRWVEVEMLRYREASPNPASEPTRYLKVAVYHYSSVDPEHGGCAAHGSNTEAAATAALERLESFQQAIENSFCCGASIDLLLMGLDTDTDTLRIHVPDRDGKTRLDRFVDTGVLFAETARLAEQDARQAVDRAIAGCQEGVLDGTRRFISRLVENNFSQIAYVRSYYGEHYADAGHAERFIGLGVGFEEKQLRNLMYFVYLSTVEETTQDLDVGINIFSGLNISHGLPAPVVVRFDYPGKVPGARERAIEQCARVHEALVGRYQKLFDKGLLHVLQVVRDCTSDALIEVVGCTIGAVMDENQAR